MANCCSREVRRRPNAAALLPRFAVRVSSQTNHLSRTDVPYQGATMPPPIPHEGATAQGCAQNSAHQEWLLDEAIMETFPASDPTSPYRSDSTTRAPETARRYPTPLTRARRSAKAAFWWIIAGCAMSYAGYVASRRRRWTPAGASPSGTSTLGLWRDAGGHVRRSLRLASRRRDQALPG